MGAPFLDWVILKGSRGWRGPIAADKKPLCYLAGLGFEPKQQDGGAARQQQPCLGTEAAGAGGIG